MIAPRTRLPPFRGDVDIDRLIASGPRDHSIKGAFVASNAAIVARDWHLVEPTLLAPPRGGKYLTFTSYPLADFLRISDAAARRTYPGVGTREGHRLLTRSTFDTFAQTTLGRVALSLVSGPASLLAKYEEMFKRMVSGPTCTLHEVAATAVDLEYTNYFHTREAIFGVLEGSVMACGFEPHVTVDAKGEGRYVAHVTWSAS